jgi:secondary thiamine-phosphate synthase enzyme
MRFFQKKIELPAFPRGYHLITDAIAREFTDIKNIKIGQLHVFLQHTSAALTINEDADPSVRRDFEVFINDLIPEDYKKFIHTSEGKDDMPAHIKSSFFGCDLHIPIKDGKLQLGTWQGIYLCEFRNHGGARSLVLTCFGEGELSV